MAEKKGPKYPPKPNPKFDFRGVRLEFDYPRQMRYLEALRTDGRRYTAAEICGVSVHAVRKLIAEDAEFAEAVEMAEQAWVDEVLQKEAVRRAVEGVQEPIIGGKDRDQIITYVQKYSDTLLQFMMRSKRSEFRQSNDKEGGSNSGKYANGQGGVLALPPGPETPEGWEASLGPLCRAPDAQGAQGAQQGQPAQTPPATTAPPPDIARG